MHPFLTQTQISLLPTWVLMYHLLHKSSQPQTRLTIQIFLGLNFPYVRLLPFSNNEIAYYRTFINENGYSWLLQYSQQGIETKKLLATLVASYQTLYWFLSAIQIIALLPFLVLFLVSLFYQPFYDLHSDGRNDKLELDPNFHALYSNSTHRSCPRNATRRV